MKKPGKLVVIKLLVSLLYLLPITLPLSAQQLTNNQIEKTLTGIYEQIVSFPYGGGLNQLDALEHDDSLFAQKMLFYTSHYPATLTYSFDSLHQLIHITSSGDGQFRIYSWDTWDGGSMHSFRNIFQYKYKGKVYSKLSADTGTDENYDPGVFYTHIYRLKKENKQYLALGHGIYSHASMGTRIKFFSVEGNTLNDTLSLFEKPNGKPSNTVNVYYNTQLNYPHTEFIIPDDVEYDPDHRRLSIPIVVGERDSMTNQKKIYQFNGTTFHFIKKTD